MTNYSIERPVSKGRPSDERLLVLVANSMRAAAVALPLLIGVAGCQTPQFTEFTDLVAHGLPAESDPLVLHEGDSVRISFPGAPTLNTVAQIKQDGRIALQLVGECKAAGLTAGELEKELLKLYGPQLQTKEVTVAVESAAFRIYVLGAVLRPGKIMSDRPMTALEAILEAGGFDYTKANQKAVRVVRRENGHTGTYKLNLKRVLKGEEEDSFSLKPSDIIYVPERFSWF